MNAEVLSFALATNVFVMAAGVSQSPSYSGSPAVSSYSGSPGVSSYSSSPPVSSYSQYGSPVSSMPQAGTQPTYSHQPPPPPPPQFEEGRTASPSHDGGHTHKGGRTGYASKAFNLGMGGAREVPMSQPPPPPPPAHGQFW